MTQLETGKRMLRGWRHGCKKKGVLLRNLYELIAATRDPRHDRAADWDDFPQGFS